MSVTRDVLLTQGSSLATSTFCDRFQSHILSVTIADHDSHREFSCKQQEQLSCSSQKALPFDLCNFTQLRKQAGLVLWYYKPNLVFH